MDISFDPIKKKGNIEKHGIAFDRFVELDVLAVLEDDRFAEPRLRLYSLIDDVACCAAVVIRDDEYRVISLRRAHRKEMQRHAKKD